MKILVREVISRACFAELSVQRQSRLRRRWRSTGLVQDTSVCSGMVANRFGLLVLCFLGLVFLSQWGKHEWFVKYFLRLRSNGKRSERFFFNFRQPPSTLHIHSSDRERMWPEAHCHARDFRPILTMVYVCCTSSVLHLMHRSFSYQLWLAWQTCIHIIAKDSKIDFPLHFVLFLQGLHSCEMAETAGEHVLNTESPRRCSSWFRLF